MLDDAGYEIVGILGPPGVGTDFAPQADLANADGERVGGTTEGGPAGFGPRSAGADGEEPFVEAAAGAHEDFLFDFG